MAAYRGEYLLKNPFLGSSLVKRAKAGFQDATEMQKVQENLYQGALEGGAKGRSTYMSQIMPEHLAKKAEAEKQIGIHGYARAQQAIQTSVGENYLAKKAKKAKQGGKRKAAEYEAQMAVPRKQRERVQARTEDQTRTVQSMEEGGVSPDDKSLIRAKTKLGRLEEKLAGLKNRGEGVMGISKEAERMHSDIISTERQNLARAALERNTFFGGSEFASTPDTPSYREQFAQAYKSYHPGYYGRKGVGLFQAENPNGYNKWFNTRRQIEEAYAPGMSRGWGQGIYKSFEPEAVAGRGESPMSYANTAQGLFERGTAYAAQNYQGNEDTYSRDWSAKEQERLQKRGSLYKRFMIPTSIKY